LPVIAMAEVKGVLPRGYKLPAHQSTLDRQVGNLSPPTDNQPSHLSPRAEGVQP
jgi:hypothetical protein